MCRKCGADEVSAALAAGIFAFAAGLLAGAYADATTVAVAMRGTVWVMSGGMLGP